MSEARKLTSWYVCSMIAFLLALFGLIYGPQAFANSTEVAVRKGSSTYGNVDIALVQKERDADGDLIPYADEDILSPISGNVISTAGADENGLPAASGFVDMVVSVAQDPAADGANGSDEAYVRVVVALPEGLELVDGNWGKQEGNFAWTRGETVWTTINGKPHSLHSFTYDNVLPGCSAQNDGGEIPETSPAVLGVYLVDENVGPKELKVLVHAQAASLQSSDTLTAVDGAVNILNAAFGEISEQKHPWLPSSTETE